MADFWRKAVNFGLGVWDFTKEKVDAVVEEMIKRGEVSQQERSEAVEQIVEKAQAEQEAFLNKVKELISRSSREMGVARQTDLEALEKRVAALEAELQEVRSTK